MSLYRNEILLIYSYLIFKILSNSKAGQIVFYNLKHLAGSGSRADDHAGKVLGNAFWSKLVDKSSYKVFYTYQGWQGTIFPYIVTQKAYG